MTSISRECCGYGRDQIVYNREYTYLQRLKEKAYAEIKPTADTIIVNHSTQMQSDLLDGSTFNITYKSGGIRPLYSVIPDIVKLAKKPQSIYYMAFPNASDGGEFTTLLKYYTVVETKGYEIDGYSLKVYRLQFIRSPQI